MEPEKDNYVTLEYLVESYINGNINYVKGYIQDGLVTLAELFEEYLFQHNPNKDNMILFIKRLS